MSDYWTDWSQSRRIEEAEAALHGERQARSRLAEQMRRQQGDLQAQIDRLTQAFVALLEHEDIRAELSQHTEAAATRRYAGDVVASVIVTGAGPTHQVSVPRDIPGYWLSAAAAALAAGTGPGPSPAATELVEEARRRDPRRTAALLTLVDLQARRVEWSRDHLEVALTFGAEASVLQRQLWTAVAEGRLDTTAEEQLAERLRVAVEALAHPDVDAAVLAALPAYTGSPGRATSQAKEYEAHLLRLRTLAGCLRGEGAGGGRSAPLQGRDLEVESTAEAAEDPLAECTLALIGQGSPAESDILARMADVRRTLGYDDPGARSTDVDAAAGSVLDLLLTDFTEATRAPGTGLHGLAVSVLTPALLRVTDQLEAEATRPAPRSVDLRFRDDVVTVTTSGATQPWQEQAARTIPERRLAWATPTAIACGVVALLCGALGFVNGAWFLLALLALGAGGGVLYARYDAQAQVVESRRHAVARWQREIDEQAKRLAGTQETQATAATSAASTAAAIRDVLAPQGAEPATP